MATVAPKMAIERPNFSCPVTFSFKKWAPPKTIITGPKIEIKETSMAVVYCMPIKRRERTIVVDKVPRKKSLRRSFFERGWFLANIRKKGKRMAVLIKNRKNKKLRGSMKFKVYLITTTATPQITAVIKRDK